MSKIILFCGLFAVVAVVYAQLEDFDNVDVDEILASQRLVDNYISCFKTGQKCSPEGQKARELLPEVLKTNCAKCTEAQNVKIKKILDWITVNRPDEFLELENQYDPEHKYREEFKDQLEKRNIVLPPLK
ncbi:hypothetical protein FQR65_LT09305 [Abscondita terminalis]|nr:hypothetical protein FQR65_LT09305 [Abscondita terminalis]